MSLIFAIKPIPKRLDFCFRQIVEILHYVAINKLLNMVENQLNKIKQKYEKWESYKIV